MRALADVPSHYPSDRLALVHGDMRWTFGDLDARAATWAGWLIGQGVIADDLVAFSLPNGPDFIALAFGIYRAGATPAPISGKLPPFERDGILAVMRPRVFVDATVSPDAPPVGGAGHVAAAWKACTSGGSTGRPKVIVDARPASFAPVMEFIGIPADSVVLVPGPLYHNAPFSAAVFALWRGSTVITMDRFDSESALRLIEAEQVVWSIMVPTMLHRIWALPTATRDSYDLSRWAMVVHTAAPMAPWLKRAWIGWRGADHIWEVYGATEGLVRCWIGGADWLARPGSVGRPVGGARIRILDEDGAEVAVGAPGEIFAMPPGGPGSSYRYIGAERRATADGWESVGDCGHVDADGYLFLADRRADLIISGGVNIWPAEVEAAVLRHPAVRSCAVIGDADADLGQIVHAIVETDAVLTLGALCAFLGDFLVRDKWPRRLTCRSKPVRDDAGKFRKPKRDSMAPTLTQFRLDFPANGLVHLVFDCPGRTMNVFSEAAIEDLARFAAWLPDADVKGVLIRSGKDNAFCAGADLGELGVAYDMIVAAPERARFGIAFDHFFQLSLAMRALETAGKPVAAAVAGLALGGGCELTLAAHYRILVDDPKIGLGLPESLVGLLPGAGGTQRLPRLIGAAAALPILLDGARLSGRAALDAGMVDALAPLGEEVAMAEAWLLSSPEASQPWDRDDWVPETPVSVSAIIAPIRARVLAETLGHYPAPLAILDCVEHGLPQEFEGAIRSEMAIFSYLIQRREARDMIQTMFLGKTDHDRAVRKGGLPATVADAVAALTPIIAQHTPMLRAAGFGGTTGTAPARQRTGRGYWIDGDIAARGAMEAIVARACGLAAGLSVEERRMADYALVSGAGFPAYLGGPFAQAE